MQIIEIVALDNGAHRNQTGDMTEVPAGWAVIPDGMETPNFPFGSIAAGEINGVMTVTGWTPGEVPEPDPQPEPAATLEARVAALEQDAAADREALNILLGGAE